LNTAVVLDALDLADDPATPVVLLKSDWFAESQAQTGESGRRTLHRHQAVVAVAAVAVDDGG